MLGEISQPDRKTSTSIIRSVLYVEFKNKKTKINTKVLDTENRLVVVRGRGGVGEKGEGDQRVKRNKKIR